jgi:uncharacterized damage-inducible protein DinB
MNSMLLKSFQYKSWADQRTIAAMRKIDQAQFGPKFSFAQQQLNHMIIVEELFKSRLLGEAAPHSATNTATLPSLDELQRRIEASNAWFSEFAAQASGLSEKFIAFQFVDGLQGSLSHQEVLFHIINHGTYHRGAIGHALDLSGVAHPADTYTVFIHQAEPDRRINPGNAA